MYILLLLIATICSIIIFTKRRSNQNIVEV
ncbi:Loki-CTERM sorting domain-containing protein [Fenollaria timonensis]